MQEQEKTKIGLWKHTFLDKSGKEKTMYRGNKDDLKYSIFPNDFKSEGKHPDLILNIEKKEQLPAQGMPQTKTAQEGYKTWKKQEVAQMKAQALPDDDRLPF